MTADDYNYGTCDTCDLQMAWPKGTDRPHRDCQDCLKERASGALVRSRMESLRCNMAGGIISDRRALWELFGIVGELVDLVRPK